MVARALAVSREEAARALQLLDNRSEAFVKVLAVCLAVLHSESVCERRLRRAAVAYGVAFRPSEEARTHRYLLILRRASLTQGGFLHKILR